MEEDTSARLERLGQVLTAAAAGELGSVDASGDDPLAAVERGVNAVIDALRVQLDEAVDARRELDDKVAERTRELHARIEEVTRQTKLIARQRDAINELSSPALQLWRGVIAMPIIGHVDDQRSALIADRLLASVATGSARYAILDLTAVDVVDTATVDHLVKVVQAVQMLGARCIITGIQPSAALTLTSLGVSFEQVETRRNLQDGLRACLLAMEDEDERAGQASG